MSLDAFRADTRAWLEAKCPASMRTPMPEAEQPWGGKRFAWRPDAKAWKDAMAERGFTAPEWPKEYGGGGLGRDEARVLSQELTRIGARPALISFGLWMLGPTLLEFGTEEQKNRILPDIVRGEVRWCQGYSEPGAGSDLASLQMKAEDKGDHWLVNGQKVWTSYADQADAIFALVRTDTTRKHEGISFLLLENMAEDPGIETRAIRLISGDSPFCETFFRDAKAPKDNLVGGLGKGWTVAKRLLQHERTMIANFGLASGALGGAGGMEEALRERGMPEGLRDDLLRHKMEGASFALTLRRAGDEAKAGANVNRLASMFKYCGSEHNKRRYELLMEIFGFDGLGWEGEGFPEAGLRAGRRWLRSRANSIEGGTSEVQLNVIAKRVLDLPTA